MGTCMSTSSGRTQKKGWRSEGVDNLAVIIYSSMSSFGGLGLSDEDCVEDNMGLDEQVRLL